jgi:hypothetical protein
MTGSLQSTSSGSSAGTVGIGVDFIGWGSPL